MDLTLDSAQTDLTNAIETASVAAAEALVDGYASRTSYQATLHALLEPVLYRIGAAWEAGRPAILAQGYLAAKLTERVLLRAMQESPLGAHKPLDWGPAIVGNIEDDFHALGRKMVSTFLQASGWEVVDLGNDVPVATFIQAAKERGARVIGVSAMMYTTAVNISRLREAMVESGLAGRVQLAVGGAVFNLRPELVAEVGGDGSARTAIAAPALFESLAKKSQELAPSP
jgi:methanogenic corrinoid protein MtbC1